LVHSSIAFADPTCLLRVEWGRSINRPRQWQGVISVDHGTLSVVRTLGVEADEPGSVWADGDHVEIRQRRPRAYAGLDISANSPLNATVSFEFRDTQDPGAPPVTGQTTLADLLSKPPLNRQLDNAGNRLQIRRAPGDMLRVNLSQDHLVFSPGDTLRVDVEPHFLPVAAGAAMQLRARLLAN